MKLKLMRREKHGIPLNKLREQNMAVNQAALMVERIFGSPILGNPLILDKKPLTKPYFSGFVTYDNRYAYLSDSPFTMAHELVHVKDFELRPPEQKNWRWTLLHPLRHMTYKIYTEGRAVFAENLLFQKLEPANGKFCYEMADKPFKHPKHQRWRMVGGFVMTGAGLVGLMAHSKDLMTTAAAWLLYLWGAWRAASGICYYPFNESLCHLADKVGDPLRAFRLTTEKPSGLKGILRPIRFYLNEEKD